MSKATYVATCNANGEALEKTYDKAESAMAQARKWSKEEGKTSCQVFKEFAGTRAAMCSYDDGKVTKAVGGKTPASIVAEFEQRAGSNRDIVLQMLAKNLNDNVMSSDLQVALYGEINPSAKSALGMVIKGLRMAIDALNLPYHIVLDTVDKHSIVSLREGKAPSKPAPKEEKVKKVAPKVKKSALKVPKASQEE